MSKELAKSLIAEMGRIQANDINSTWLTIKETAKYTKCSVRIIYKYINDGCLIAGKVGDKYLINRNLLDRQILYRFPKIDIEKLTSEELSNFEIVEAVENAIDGFKKQKKYINKDRKQVM